MQLNVRDSNVSTASGRHCQQRCSGHSVGCVRGDAESHLIGIVVLTDGGARPSARATTSIRINDQWRVCYIVGRCYQGRTMVIEVTVDPYYVRDLKTFRWPPFMTASIVADAIMDEHDYYATIIRLAMSDPPIASQYALIKSCIGAVPLLPTPHCASAKPWARLPSSG